jgi:acetoin utilization deacetylase AcuC-like enzyme
MTTLLYTHPACLEHDPGPYHPESPARLRAVLEALDAPEFARLERREAPEAAIEDLARVHPRAVVAAVPASGHRGIDADTILSPASGHAALRAAGAVIAAVDAVVAGEADNAFCAVRPPGHHAEPGRAMGFCLFNNVAIGALRAREVHGLARVAVIDFDVHHGNGTQARFADDPSLFYAHRNDPLAQLLLEEADYTWVTERLLEVARQHAGGRVVATLEGGYDLTALKASTAAHLRVLMAV